MHDKQTLCVNKERCNRMWVGGEEITDDEKDLTHVMKAQVVTAVVPKVPKPLCAVLFHH